MSGGTGEVTAARSPAGAGLLQSGAGIEAVAGGGLLLPGADGTVPVPWLAGLDCGVAAAPVSASARPCTGPANTKRKASTMVLAVWLAPVRDIRPELEANSLTMRHKGEFSLKSSAKYSPTREVIFSDG